MKKLIFLTGILLHLISSQGLAQQPGLRPGDKVPDISMGRLLNNPKQKIRFSDFKDKLLILDFWGVACRNCISAMPGTDSLQQKFGSRIQYIYVTRDSEKQVNELFSKSRVKRPRMPFIVSDTVLEALFPHTGVPFHVWITPTGKVYALTDSYNTNEQTIAAFLAGKEPKIARRWDWGLNPDYPVVSEQNSSLLGLADCYSIFLKGLGNNSIGTGIKTKEDSLSHRSHFLSIQNADLLMLYSIAYLNELYQVPVNYLALHKNNRLILEVRDSTAFFPPKEDSELQDWIMNYQYSYELKLPEPSSLTVYQRLRQDLLWKFPYKAVIEKRKVQCLVLFDLSETDQQKAISHNTMASEFIYNKDRTITVQNLPIDLFFQQLVYLNSYRASPFISETKFKGNLQMELKARPDLIKSFNSELNRYGFGIKEEEREINMLVIKDK